MADLYALNGEDRRDLQDIRRRVLGRGGSQRPGSRRRRNPGGRGKGGGVEFVVADCRVPLPRGQVVTEGVTIYKWFTDIGGYDNLTYNEDGGRDPWKDGAYNFSLDNLRASQEYPIRVFGVLRVVDVADIGATEPDFRTVIDVIYPDLTALAGYTLATHNGQPQAMIHGLDTAGARPYWDGGPCETQVE